MLETLKDVPLERSWRMILEGALFEGRVGNKDSARKTFRLLISKCQTYGPIFFEASRYEEREGEMDEAVKLCEEGLDVNPKYGPLWFQYLRLYEKVSKKMRLERFDSLQTILNDMF